MIGRVQEEIDAKGINLLLCEINLGLDQILNGQPNFVESKEWYLRNYSLVQNLRQLVTGRDLSIDTHLKVQETYLRLLEFAADHIFG